MIQRNSNQTNQMNAASVETCATLPMYDWPEQYEATNTVWSVVRSVFHRYGLQIPTELDRTRSPMSIWTDPYLLFGQTCGLPYADHLQDITQIIGIPVYETDGIKGGRYSSRIITRKNDHRRKLSDFSGSQLVINDFESQSGCNALRLKLDESKLAPIFFSTLQVSGSHRASIRAVAESRADLCCIDPVSWDLAKRHDPAIVEVLNVIEETPYTPNLPFVCSNTLAHHLDIKEVLQNLEHAIDSLPHECYLTTRLQTIVPGNPSLYLDVKNSQYAAEENGHRLLAEFYPES